MQGKDMTNTSEQKGIERRDGLGSPDSSGCTWNRYNPARRSSYAEAGLRYSAYHLAIVKRKPCVFADNMFSRAT